MAGQTSHPTQRDETLNLKRDETLNLKRDETVVLKRVDDSGATG